VNWGAAYDIGISSNEHDRHFIKRSVIAGAAGVEEQGYHLL
jgi:hypothetical protein